LIERTTGHAADGRRAGQVGDRLSALRRRRGETVRHSQDQTHQGIPAFTEAGFNPRGARVVYFDTVRSIGTYTEIIWLDSEGKAFFDQIKRGSF